MTVNCPKCGYEQEERLDCGKCGIVFSKYIALHHNEKVQHPEGTESFQTKEPSEEESDYGLLELRQTLRDLSRRFGEVEFERAHRNQLRAEIKNLDQKLQEGMTSIASRMEEAEKRWSERDFIETQKDMLRTGLDPIIERIELSEARIEKLANEPALPPDTSALDAVRRLEQHAIELERKVSAIAEEQSRKIPGPTPQSYEKVTREVDELRSALQGVTMRYSEIGDLKKNHLIIQSGLETLKQELDILKNDVAKAGNGKLAELRTELQALKAEVRQTLQRTESLEKFPQICSGELTALRDDLSALKGSRSGDDPRTSNAIAAIDLKFKERLQPFSRLAEDVARIDTLYKAVEADLRNMQDAVKSAPQRQAALEGDLSAVRDEIGEIRLKLDSLWSKSDGRRSETQEDDMHPAEESVQSILASLDDLRGSIANLRRKH